MKKTGIMRRLDDLGRLCMPIEIRRIMDLNAKSELEIYIVQDNKIYLKNHINTSNDIAIVRKIDKLGRLVIPAEIRLSLDIGTSDCFEFFLDDDIIILEKYIPLGLTASFIKDLCDTVAETTNLMCIICDTKTKTIISSSTNKIEFPKKLALAVNKGVSYNCEDDTFMLSISVKNSTNQVFKVKLLAPLILKNIVMGSVILVETDKNTEIKECDLIAFKMAVSFSEKRLARELF